MRFWDITRKDLSVLWRDRRTLALLLVLPMAFITIIGLTTGELLGWQNSNQMLQIGWYCSIDYDAIEHPDYDDEAEHAKERRKARVLVAKILNSLQSNEGIKLHEAPNLEVLEEMRENKKNVTGKRTQFSFIIGPDFWKRVNELYPTDILDRSQGPLKDGIEALDVTLSSGEGKDSQGTTHAIVERQVFGSILESITPHIICKEGGAIAVRFGDVCRRLEAEAELEDATRVLGPDEGKEAPSGKSRVYEEVVPSFTVMFVFFLVNIMARSFIHERDLGTLRRLQIAPISSSNILIGKTLPFLVVSIVQTILLFGFGKLTFHMDWGTQPWLLIPVGLCTSIAATTLGLLVATLVRTDGQVSAYANFVVIILAGISGCFLPRDWLPDMMRDVSLVTPHAWALIAYDEILTQAKPDVGVIFTNCGILIAFSAAFFLGGAWRFRCE